MQLLKVIVTSVAATANLFTGMLTGVPCESPSAEQSVEARKENEAFSMEALAQNTVSTVLAQYGNKGESSLAQRQLDADAALDEEMHDRQETAPGDDGREVADAKSTGNAGKAADTDKAKSAQKQDDASLAAVKGSAEDSAEKALASAGDVYGFVPASVASTLNAPTSAADSKPADAAVNSVGSAQPASSASTQPASSASAPASAVAAVDKQASSVAESAPAVTAPSAPPTQEAAAPAPKPTYDHTTSIYSNGYEALLRVEYYDENNKLFEYSSVTDYDKDTNSYTETVYRWDDETDSQVTMRTDTYVNGELVSSESP